MSITTGTVNAPPSGTNPILVANNVTVSGNTGDAQMIALVDPDSTSLRVASISANGLKTDSFVNNFPANYGPGRNATGTGQFVPVADTTVAINVNNATATLITGVIGKSIYVCSYVVDANGTGTVQWAYGATPTAISGAMAVTAETGISAGSGYGPVLIIPSGQDFKIVTTTQIQGHLSYTQF